MQRCLLQDKKKLKDWAVQQKWVNLFMREQMQILTHECGHAWSMPNGKQKIPRNNRWCLHQAQKQIISNLCNPWKKLAPYTISKLVKVVTHHRHDDLEVSPFPDCPRKLLHLLILSGITLHCLAVNMDCGKACLLVVAQNTETKLSNSRIRRWLFTQIIGVILHGFFSKTQLRCTFMQFWSPLIVSRGHTNFN